MGIILSNKILIVEDDDSRIAWFKSELVGNSLHITKKAKDAIKLLKLHTYGLIFLDHDLAEQHYIDNRCYDGTGPEVAKFLADTKENNNGAVIIIHSLNIYGVDRMFDLLQGRTVAKINYLLLKQKGIAAFIGIE